MRNLHNIVQPLKRYLIEYYQYQDRDKTVAISLTIYETWTCLENVVLSDPEGRGDSGMAESVDTDRTSKLLVSEVLLNFINAVIITK